MALPPAVQIFTINATEYLAGIDAMLSATDKLAESIDAVVVSAVRLDGVFDGLADADARVAETLNAAAEAAARMDEAGAGVAGAQSGIADTATAATEAETALTNAERAAAEAAQFERDFLAELSAAYKGLADSQRAVVASSAEVTATLARTDAILEESAGAVATASVEQDAALRQQALAADAAAAADTRAGEAAAGMSTMMKAAFLGVVIAAGIGIEQASKFQSTMLTLNTQAGVSKSALGGLSQGVLSLAGQVGDSPNSLATALYHVESSFASVGITGQKALSLLQIAAEGAAVGHADLVDVTNALDATIVAGVPGITSYSQAMGTLNAIVGSGDMTMQDLANAMGTGVMAVAKSYGQSIYQVGAALALFGDNNIRGAKAATELRMAWQAMQAPLTTAGAALTSIGLTSTTLASTMEHHGMSAAIDQFIEHLKASHVPMSDWGQLETEIFGKKAGVGIGIMVDQYGRLMSKFPDLEKGAKGFGTAWANTQKNFDQQWRDFMAGLDALVISFGTKLLPAVTLVVGQLAKFFVFLEKHGEIAAFAGAIVAVAIAFKAAEQAAALFKGLSLLEDVNVPMLVVMGIILLAAALYELYKHSKLVRDIVADVGHALERAFTVAVAAAKVAVKWIIGAFDDIDRAAKELPGKISRTWDDVASGAAEAGHATSHAFSSGWDDVYRDTVGEVVRAFEGVKGAITSGFDGWWKSHGKEIEEVWRVVWATVSGIFAAAWGALADIFQSVAGIIGAVWTTVVTITKIAWSAISGELKDAWDIIAAVFKIGFDAIDAYVKTGWDIAVAIFRVYLSVIELVVKTAWDVIAAVFKIVWAAITAVVKIGWDVIVGIFSIALDVITGHWSKAWTDLQTMFVQVWNAIKAFWGTTLSAMTALVVQVLNNIRQFFISAWNDIWTATRQVWNNIKGFLEQAWNAILALGHQVWNNLIAFLNQAWHDIYTGVVSAWGSVVTFFEGVPAKIIGALGDLLTMLYNAGVQIVQGLINGLGSMADAAAHEVEHIGDNIKSAFMSVVHLGSPSKDFYRYGAWITQGLADGISQTAAVATAKAAKLAADVKAAYQKGQITSAEETELLGDISSAIASRGDKLVTEMRKLSLDMRSGMLAELENAGSESAVKTAIDKLIGYVQDAWSVGDISFTKASALTTWLTYDNSRLYDLAAKRKALDNTIAAADKYAATTTTNTESWAGLSNVTSSMTSGGMVYSGNILAGMKTDLSQINQFSAALKKLGSLGLSKNLLNQIIQMGPASGLQVAQALIDGPLSVIRSMNATQSAINSASTSLGQSAADLMYDSGSQAGKGFLSGLKAQQANITAMMDQIAKSMVTTIEKDLKIHSPSLVTTEHGEMIALGLIAGMQHGVPGVKSMAHALAVAATPGSGQGGAGTGSGGSGNTTITVQVHVDGFVGDNQQLATEIYKVVQEEALIHDRRNGNNGLSLTF